MSGRDPRNDPLPGDLLVKGRTADAWASRLVKERHGDDVLYFASGVGPGSKSGTAVTTLLKWRTWASGAQVEQRAEEGRGA